MPLASITFNFLNGWVEPIPPFVPVFPLSGTIGDQDSDGTTSDNDPGAVLSSRNRTGTIT